MQIVLIVHLVLGVKMSVVGQTSFLKRKKSIIGHAMMGMEQIGMQMRMIVVKIVMYNVNMMITDMMTMKSIAKTF